ncbi:MAG TPA: ABC transporter permease [Cellvibrionaceae bacterium]|nr:ABC transporter permease [Cellvibrionaceae bacterium]HMW71004.1 ABC transporter permease [Cellvibrionaceae bacterium]HMY38008.1 ABC transporter permease [Marinagarivorans sp.]HNG61631.1 ABC transporter permease [Cellvibrionaceae bacterium]
MSANLISAPNSFFVSALLKQCVKSIALPLVGFAIFLLLWEFGSSKVQTSLGQFPGPAIVFNQVQGLYQEYKEDKASRAAFYERQEKRFAEARAQDPNYVAEHRQYSGKPTFIQQIFTSLKTVFTGFLLASLIAIPLGIAVGLSANLYAAINPLIQLFKPISPLAWLPLVTIVVSAVYSNPDGVPKSFITSSMTVMLCSLWPTLINTAVGVTSVSSDLINVSRVLRLNWLRHVRSIVLPSAVPMIFTGLRLSLGIAWMVLIAAEMLAQNPGLGKFVWDEFQNGSSDSLGRIMVAVLTIGVIGYLLDRGMLLLQKVFSWDKQAILR